MYGFKDVIVAKPQIYSPRKKRKVTKRNIFLYPSLPRFQKNFEVICKASEYLKKKKLNYEIQFTFNQDECRYSKYIYNISKNNPNIKFLGRKRYDQMKDLYLKSNFLIFSSKLETWGLPLSEAISFNLPILVSNLAYAKETLGNYDKIYYFDPNNPKKLSEILYKVITKQKKFSNSEFKMKYKKNSLNLPWKKIT
jgi:glycosyltransferase involved in cell wall biosynthesis